jgi:hypothetical protein
MVAAALQKSLCLEGTGELEAADAPLPHLLMKRIAFV